MLLRLLIIVFVTFSAPVSALVILQYHHISHDTPHSTSITPELFKQHLDYIQDNQFNVISLDDFVSALRDKKPFADKSVLITFDDGYRSIYDQAFPLLKRKGFPFTVFVNTQPIGHNLNQFMSWQELQVMSQHQATIANHSVTHPHFIRRLANESEVTWQARITGEIVEAQKLIEKHLGHSLKVFAYPFGEYDDKTQAILADLGYIALGQQSGAVPINVDLQSIPRFAFGGDYGAMDEFKTKINSLPMPIKTLQLLNENGQVLDSHILTLEVNQPAIAIELEAKFSSLQIACYASGQGRLEPQFDGSKQVFKTKRKLPVGRSRFNCTAPAAQKGRFYWYTQPWIKRNPDGSWYAE